MDLLAVVQKQQSEIEKIFEELEKSKEETRKTRHSFNEATNKLDKVYAIYKDLKHDYDDLKLQNESLQKDTRLLLDALKDNPLTQEKGLISRLKDVESFMTWAKEKKAVATGYILGITIMITILGTIWAIAKWAWSHIMIH